MKGKYVTSYCYVTYNSVTMLQCVHILCMVHVRSSSLHKVQNSREIKEEKVEKAELTKA